MIWEVQNVSRTKSPKTGRYLGAFERLRAPVMLRLLTGLRDRKIVREPED